MTARVMERMPNFVRPIRLGRHVLDTALGELRARGISDDLVRIHPVSAGGGHGTVVAQSPAAGELIDRRDGVHLYVELTALMDRLPYAMRDEEPDAFGTDQILGLFDSSAAHAGHFIRIGGDLFTLREGDDRSARRWLDEVFAIDPSLFHRARWHRLVRFAARLHAIAGRPEAIVTGLRAVFGIPASIVRLAHVPAPDATRCAASLSGTQSHLGLTTVLGGEPTTMRHLVVSLGPVSLEQFEEHRDLAIRQERMNLYRLCLPFWLDAEVTERWRVAGRDEGMRLDAQPAAAARLGWTSYLGEPAHGHRVEMTLD